MPRIVKRSASQAVKSGRSRRGVPLPEFVPPQFSHPVEKPPSGPQWLHEIKLDGFAWPRQSPAEQPLSARRLSQERCYFIAGPAPGPEGIDHPLEGRDDPGSGGYRQAPTAATLFIPHS
jgi:hypothetical protein